MTSRKTGGNARFFPTTQGNLIDHVIDLIDKGVLLGTLAFSMTYGVLYRLIDQVDHLISARAEPRPERHFVAKHSTTGYDSLMHHLVRW